MQVDMSYIHNWRVQMGDWGNGPSPSSRKDLFNNKNDDGLAIKTKHYYSYIMYFHCSKHVSTNYITLHYRISNATYT